LNVILFITCRENKTKIKSDKITQKNSRKVLYYYYYYYYYYTCTNTNIITIHTVFILTRELVVTDFSARTAKYMIGYIEVYPWKS
jgi:hypothetical protein